MPIALFTGKFLDTVLTLYWVWPWCTGQSVPQTGVPQTGVPQTGIFDIRWLQLTIWVG